MNITLVTSVLLRLVPLLPVFVIIQSLSLFIIMYVAIVSRVHGELTYFAVADQSTQHLQNLIQRQKSNPKKSKSFKKVYSAKYTGWKKKYKNTMQRLSACCVCHTVLFLSLLHAGGIEGTDFCSLKRLL